MATVQRAEPAGLPDAASQPAREQSRARHPDAAGFIERDGVRIHWERYADGTPTIMLLPTWSIIHSRAWKGQIPYLARHFRVVTFDGRGNGRSDRPRSTPAYDSHEFAEDAVAVLDATATDRAIVVGFSMGAGYALQLAAEHPERVSGAVLVGPSLSFGAPTGDAPDPSFEERQPSEDGWARYNAHAWRRDWGGFSEWFFHQVYNEPHSTKQIEDAGAWALETDPETMIVAERARYLRPAEAWGSRAADEPDAMSFIRRVQCPCLVIQGEADLITPVATGRRLAEELGAPLVVMGGSGHNPFGRDPVSTNLLIRDFVSGLEART